MIFSYLSRVSATGFVTSRVLTNSASRSKGFFSTQYRCIGSNALQGIQHRFPPAFTSNSAHCRALIFSIVQHPLLSISRDVLLKGYQTKTSAPRTDDEEFDGQTFRQGQEERERLGNLLAAAGVGSRRHCAALVKEGVVSVNGVAASQPGLRIDPINDVVTVKGETVSLGGGRELFYIALNKPRGYICSDADFNGNGMRVIDLLKPFFAEWSVRKGVAKGNATTPPPRLFTVGRLDVASSGLLFLTNDGDWAQKVAHPSFSLTKEYMIETPLAPTMAQLEAMRRGTYVTGVHCVPLLVQAIQQPVAGGATQAIHAVRSAVKETANTAGHSSSSSSSSANNGESGSPLTGGDSAASPHSFSSSDAPPRRHLVKVVVSEGRKHEVRELARAAGVEIRFLRRTRVGAFRLPRGLDVGQFMLLTREEANGVVVDTKGKRPPRGAARHEADSEADRLSAADPFSSGGKPRIVSRGFSDTPDDSALTTDALEWEEPVGRPTAAAAAAAHVFGATGDSLVKKTSSGISHRAPTTRGRRRALDDAGVEEDFSDGVSLRSQTRDNSPRSGSYMDLESELSDVNGERLWNEGSRAPRQRTPPADFLGVASVAVAGASVSDNGSLGDVNGRMGRRGADRASLSLDEFERRWDAGGFSAVGLNGKDSAFALAGRSTTGDDKVGAEEVAMGNPPTRPSSGSSAWPAASMQPMRRDLSAQLAAEEKRAGSSLASSRDPWTGGALIDCCDRRGVKGRRRGGVSSSSSKRSGGR